MLKFRALLIGLGLAAVGGGGYAIVIGKIKWDPEKMLHGTQARLVGLGLLIFGVALLAGGLLFPEPIWDSF